MLARHVVLMALSALAALMIADALAPVRYDSQEAAARARVAEESEIYRSGRERRQTRRQPNVFVAFFQLLSETRRDLQRTFNEIAREVENSIVDENEVVNTTTAAPSSGGSTTAAPVRITRQEILRVLSRNWRGLTRLFNQEVDLAVNQSNRNAAEARRAFWDSLSTFLEPATTTTTTTTTTTPRPRTTSTATTTSSG